MPSWLSTFIFRPFTYLSAVSRALTRVVKTLSKEISIYKKNLETLNFNHTHAMDDLKETLKLVDETSTYALTGAIFAHDRYAITLAVDKLVNAAGNFYINDKPTGAVVGQQPFGGARGSGTNDKAGSKLNLYRWISPRMIKETFVTPTDYRYPFLG